MLSAVWDHVLVSLAIVISDGIHEFVGNVHEAIKLAIV